MEQLRRPQQQTTRVPHYLYIQTFGCQMNEYDSLRVERMLTARGYHTTSDIEAADVIFLNTCSVRDKAEQKVHSFLGRLRRLKTRRPDLKLIVAGCVAQQLGQSLLQRFDYLDLVVGTRGIPDIPQLLEKLEGGARRSVFLPEREENAGWQDLFQRSSRLASEVVAPVTIMQGCNNFCTYCIVPYVRGRERSRPTADIIREIRRVAAGGAREVLLLGQNVNSYGHNLEEKASFVELLQRIQEETDIVRLRFTTSHPKDLTQDLIACFAELPILCKSLHLPVQSGSDRVLKLMNRGYTTAHYLEKIARLRETCPDIALSSDVMVGFPGETEQDFQQTLSLLEQVQYDALFSFRYSDRPFARAVDLADKIPEAIKSRRLTALQGLQAAISMHKNQAEVGLRREVLVESPSKTAHGQFTGRTQQNRIVNFQGHRELIGQVVPVQIVAAFSHSLKGELTTATEDPSGP